MPSAPLITVDGAGVAAWTNPAITPDAWVIELCFLDATPPTFFQQATTVSGGLNTYDAYSAGWQGGCALKLYGIDANQNVIIAPTVSTTLTKNQ